MSRILAIDYGSRRVGLAVTDPLQIIATPLTTVQNSDALEFIVNYIKTESVKVIVVGEPFRWSGEHSDIEKDIRKFIDKILEKIPKVEVARQNEQFTSSEAKRALIQSGVKKKKRRDKGLLDSTAATLILQDYLREHT